MNVTRKSNNHRPIPTYGTIRNRLRTLTATRQQEHSTSKEPDLSSSSRSDYCKTRKDAK